MKCYTHLIRSVHGHTQTRLQLVEVHNRLSSFSSLCVCVCTVSIHWSATLKPNRIFQSRAAERQRLIQAYCELSTESRVRPVLAPLHVVWVLVLQSWMAKPSNYYPCMCSPFPDTMSRSGFYPWSMICCKRLRTKISNLDLKKDQQLSFLNHQVAKNYLAEWQRKTFLKAVLAILE